MTYYISKLKDKHALTFHPAFDEREDALNYCQVLNEEHRKGQTGEVFIVTGVAAEYEYDPPKDTRDYRDL